MLLIGLTGSIATGKSTVSSILTSPPYSLPIIDADIIARQVVAPGTAGYNKIVAHFSPSTPDLLLTNEPEPIAGKGHYLNRPALGRRVFGDSPERARDRAVLNGIVHPAVRWEMYRQLLRHYLSGAWAVVLDVPLLFESGLDGIVGTVIVVSVSDPAIQMERLMKRDSHLTSEDARNRVLSQGDVRDKARRCLARNSESGEVQRGAGRKDVGGPRGYVLYNDTDIAALKDQIGDVMRRIQEGSPKWWAWLLLLFPPAAGLAGVATFLRNRRINEAWKGLELDRKAKL